MAATRNPDFFESIGMLYSRENAKTVEKELSAAGVLSTGERFLGFSTVMVLLLTLLVGTMIQLIDPIVAFLRPFSFGHYFILFILFYLVGLIISATSWAFFVMAYLALRKDAITDKVEKVFPDYLNLVSANMRAGMNVEQAMIQAAKPEFGELSAVVHVAISSSLSGSTIHQALDRLSETFDSPLIKRAMKIIKQAVATGGSVADAIDKIAEDAREREIVKNDIKASLLFYQIFIVFGGMVGAPFLLSVSYKLLQMLEKVFAQIDVSAISASSSAVPFVPLGPSITSGDFFFFALAMILVTSLTSSLTVGIVGKGRWQDGAKFFVAIFLGAMLVFLGLITILNSFFQNLLI
ncbi:MAG: type II secretion system F family protein [Candidatus Anstonellales archaeon]